MIELSLALMATLQTSRKERLFSFSVAAWGISVNITCLLLLIFAEVQRCSCSADEKKTNRWLASASDYDTSNYEYSTSHEEVDCCADFGQRLYGGIGSIEPFTSLIALSPLRFIIARLIVKHFGGEGTKTDDTEDGHALHEGHGHDGPDPVTKTRDLWLTAIGLHSDVAKKYGIFSSEFLQVMLGIEVAEGHPVQKDATLPRPQDENLPSLASDERQTNSSESGKGSAIMELVTQAPATKPSLTRTFGVSFDDFAYPRARLIRRMRRCERRILPYLDEWMLVDVVLTNHELVIFDVADNYDSFARIDMSRNAVMSKSGGKGMRLCDVAAGRKILSQFELDDINLVDIEHRKPVEGDRLVEDIERNDQQHLLEYWQGAICDDGDYNLVEMNHRWDNVNEDRLKIRFSCSTLYLRLIVDLKEMESRSMGNLSEADNAGLTSSVGAQTQLWCRTIARYVSYCNVLFTSIGGSLSAHLVNSLSCKISTIPGFEEPAI